MQEIEVTIMQVDAEGRPAKDDTDYSRQDEIIQKIDPEGILSALSWKYMAADWAVALQDTQERLKAIEAAARTTLIRLEALENDCANNCFDFPEGHVRAIGDALRDSLETAQETPK